MQPFPEESSTRVAQALGRSVRTPLEALRIILEDLEAGTADATALPAAVDTLRRVRRGVESIEEFFTTRAPRPIRCTIREIAHGVRDYLPEHLRTNLLIAIDTEPRELFVDGPMLVKSLAHLAANAIEASQSPVLLRVQESETGFAFSVVGHSECEFSYRRAVEPFQTNKRGHVGLGLTLATRDIGLLGGELVVRTGPSQATRFEVLLPAECTTAEAA